MDSMWPIVCIYDFILESYKHMWAGHPEDARHNNNKPNHSTLHLKTPYVYLRSTYSVVPP